MRTDVIAQKKKFAVDTQLEEIINWIIESRLKRSQKARTISRK